MSVSAFCIVQFYVRVNAFALKHVSPQEAETFNVELA